MFNQDAILQPFKHRSNTVGPWPITLPSHRRLPAPRAHKDSKAHQRWTRIEAVTRCVSPPVVIGTLHYGLTVLTVLTILTILTVLFLAAHSQKAGKYEVVMDMIAV